GRSAPPPSARRQARAMPRAKPQTLSVQDPSRSPSGHGGTTVIGGPAVATRADPLNWMRKIATRTVCSPPPCGEGVGVAAGGRSLSHNHDPPPPPSPTRGGEQT